MPVHSAGGSGCVPSADTAGGRETAPRNGVWPPDPTVTLADDVPTFSARAGHPGGDQTAKTLNRERRAHDSDSEQAGKVPKPRPRAPLPQSPTRRVLIWQLHMPRTEGPREKRVEVTPPAEAAPMTSPGILGKIES